MFPDRLAEVQRAVQSALDDAVACLPAGELRAAIGYGAQGGKRLRALSGDRIGGAL